MGRARATREGARARQRSRHSRRHPAQGLRAALHDQGGGPWLRALDLLSNRHESWRPDHRRRRAGSGGVLHRDAAPGRTGRLERMTPAPDARTLRAEVARVDFGACMLLLEDGALLRATVRGRLMGPRKALGNAVVVGDVAAYESAGKGAEADGAPAIVTAVEPRRNAFSRRAPGKRAIEQVVAANLDQVVVVTSYAEPPFRAGLTDRVLCQAAFAGLPARLVLNK